jgi:hypothetical protein
MNSLKLPQLALECSDETKDDPACKILSDKFDATRDRMKEELAVLVKQDKEQEITTQRENLGKLVLEEMRSIAITSATSRLAFSDEECEIPAAVIGNIANIAVVQLLANNPSARKLEAWLHIKSLPDFHRRITFHSVNPADLNPVSPIHGGSEHFDELDPASETTKQVKLIVQELAKYLSFSIIDNATNELRVLRYKVQQGHLKATELLKMTHSCTSATDRAIGTTSNMAAAAVANQKAQKANPATPRKNHHPKGQGGRKEGSTVQAQGKLEQKKAQAGTSGNIRDPSNRDTMQNTETRTTTNDLSAETAPTEAQESTTVVRQRTEEEEERQAPIKSISRSRRCQQAQEAKQS